MDEIGRRKKTALGTVSEGNGKEWTQQNTGRTEALFKIIESQPKLRITMNKE